MGCKFVTRARRATDTEWSYQVTCCVSDTRNGDKWPVEAILVCGRRPQTESTTIQAANLEEAKKEALEWIRRLLASQSYLACPIQKVTLEHAGRITWQDY